MRRDEIGEKKKVCYKLMDLGIGDCFGEDYLCFNEPNTYSIQTQSTELILFSIDRQEFIKKYKRII